MAEDCDHIPSLDDLFDILSGVTEQRLFSLWYKFNPDSPRASKVHRLLYSIISFFLKKKDEAERAARSVLNKMPDNRSALYILNKVVGSGGGTEGEGERLETSSEEFAAEDGSVLTDLALMLTVLVEENLCQLSMRNRACKAAIKAFKSNNQKRSLDLQECIEEFRVLCGPLDFEDEEVNVEVSPLKSIEKASLSMRSTAAYRTNPNQIPTDSHNTSEITVPSHFEISASPTASFVSNSCRDNLNSSTANTEENTVNPVSSANVALNDSNNVLNLPSDENLGAERVTHSIGARGGKQDNVLSACSTRGPSGTIDDVRPTECTGETSSSQVVTSKSKMSGAQGTGNVEHTNSISPDPSGGVKKLSTGDQSPSSETMSARAVDESFENKFFSFVILHAPEDVEIAESLQVRLESLVNMEGATYFEEFSLPGRSPIKCIEDSVSNSAFTILLLTNNFKSRWEEYKTNIVLINSINNVYKYNSVIPLLPQKSRMPKEDIPFALRAINILDENSKHFERHVRKTFTLGVLGKHKKIWLEEQRQKQIQEKESEAQREIQNTLKTVSAQMNYMQLYNRLVQMQQLYPLPHPPCPGPAAVNGHTQPVLNPLLHPSLPVYPPGFNPLLQSILLNQPNVNPQSALYPFMQPFQVINPGNSQGGQSVTLSSSTQQQSQGTNIIQIQHARNIQIGDSNQMTITDSTESSESTDDEEEGVGEHN
ncbi:TIR domain-containing adapter molecule 1 [Mustelus asterias]